jgi:hypothetical protein
MPTPAPDNPAARQRLRGRLAALSAVGALMVALPLGQVLRSETTALQVLASQRAALDPMARALAVQRGLLAHRDVAALVLRGRQALEIERRLRQRDVNDSVAAMSAVLTAGPWERAIREADALHEDWLALVRQITGRQLSVAASDGAHRLLVEQVLQIMDLVADTSPPGSETTMADTRAMLALARTALLPPNTTDTTDAAEASARGTLQRLEQVIAARDSRWAAQAAAHAEQRAQLLAAMAALAVLALALATQLWRGLRPLPPTAPRREPDLAAHNTDRDTTGRLMQRLREGDEAPALAARGEPQATLPPTS